MARSLILLTAFFSTLTGAQSLQTFAFRGVNVVPMDAERVLTDQTVVVAHGRIQTVGASADVRIPTDATVIEGTGRYLLPGLAEMHAHVPSVINREYVEEVLFLYVANGITTARGMLGLPEHRTLRADLERHDVLGPRLITSGPSLRGDSVDSPATARRMVTEQANAGYDFIKLHPGLTRAEFDAAVAAAAEAGIQLAGHVSVDVGIGRALEAGQATIDHLDGYIQYLVPEDVDLSNRSVGFFGTGIVDLADEDRIEAAARATREAGVWNVPTQSLIEHFGAPEPSAEELAARPEMAYVSQDTVQQWVRNKQRVTGSDGYSAEAARRLVEIRQRLIKALHDEGAGLLLGSDSPQVFNVPGFALHHELRMMVAAGLSPYQAIRMGTASPAVFFSAEGEFGRVSPGLAADLILADGNPLEDVGVLSRPVGVMVRGRWLDRAEIDEGLAEIAARYR